MLRHLSLVAVAAVGVDGHCTAIAVDGGASPDGSAYAGMNADCANCDTRLAYVPAQDHTEAMRDVFSFPLPYPNSVVGQWLNPEAFTKPAGSIPQVPHTYGYYAGLQPLLNEKGLGFGESSCSVMLMNRDPNNANDTRDVPTAFIDTAALMQITLERCATARCGVDLMGELVEKYGFMPTSTETAPMVNPKGEPAYADSGEAYTLADATGEAWVFHVVGGVNGVLRSVWAAQRVPPGHAAFVANAFIIGELPSEPNDWYRFSPKVFEAGIKSGLWDGKGALAFDRAFGANEVYFHNLGMAPIPYYSSLRRYGMNHVVAPSLGLEFKTNGMDYPFSVKVEKPMTHRDVFDLFSYHYQGTEFDLTQGALAGPFETPFRIEGPIVIGQVPRGISMQRTVYSIVVQSGPERQMGWFAADTPATSVYVPLFARAKGVSVPYSTGSNQKFSRDSAWWAFDFVNNWMQLNYKAMSTQDVLPLRENWQAAIDNELPAAEKKSPEALDAWQIGIQESLFKDWWKLADFLVMKYNDQKLNFPKTGTNYGYPDDWAKMVGFSQDVHPVWVQPASRPPTNFEGYVAPTVTLPRTWDGKHWVYSEASEALADVVKADTNWSGLAAQSAYTCAVLFVGFALGRRRQVHSPTDYATLLG